MTSSLGLPGPSGNNPSDAALNRRWNEFLDTHNLRTILQTSPAQIDQQQADALAALRVPYEQRAANEAYVLSIWDQIDLIVDYLPPDVNPEWRAQEQLLKRTALRLAARRSRLKADMELCETHWEPNILPLDMAPKGKGASGKKVEVATSLINTIYYLGHEPGDPIFSYCPLPLTAPNDERNFTYRGCVPRDPREDMLRLQILLPKVVAHVVALLAFSPEMVSDFPEKCWELMDRTDDLASGDDKYGGLLSEIRTLWMHKFSVQDPAGHALVGEAAWLVCGLCRGGLDIKCPKKRRRLRGLWYGLLPLMDVLTFDKDEDMTTFDGLETIVELYVRDQGRKAHDMVFRDGEYDRALLYHEDAIHKNLKLDPSSGGGTSEGHIGGHLDPNDSDSEPVPIPDEVLAACDSINWRFGTPAEPARAEPSESVVPAAVSTAAKKKRKETGVKDATSTTTATDQKPSRKRKGGRPPKARAAAPPPPSNPTAN
ncbi:hypothetical protein CH063_09394 [Colletotrichum higginsianum]|uniref:Uncharacterized protein n=1 Tax=Colletotrichum higginsianum (strain IMI 349063) TaxID=759273 RepID=H1VDF5_COLHI|nr:hypothetical protein CH63R_11477 [Colletotrichum higginsianum IMI 349063]OBR04774.1 hypothetical protein CH63R_11477 [Colletotrichum higginsianum IMI 349063]CCF38258.1 hypothetical protein CH063_09394 [Colletotrichum higginsianum]